MQAVACHRIAGHEQADTSGQICNLTLMQPSSHGKILGLVMSVHVLRRKLVWRHAIGIDLVAIPAPGHSLFSVPPPFHALPSAQTSLGR